MRARQSVRFKETRPLGAQIQIVKPKCSERYPVNLCRLQKFQNVALAVIQWMPPDVKSILFRKSTFKI
jgi:hypothetical protein